MANTSGITQPTTAGPTGTMPNAGTTNVAVSNMLPATGMNPIENTAIPAALNANIPSAKPKMRPAPSVITSDMFSKQLGMDQSALAAINASHGMRTMQAYQDAGLDKLIKKSSSSKTK